MDHCKNAGTSAIGSKKSCEECPVWGSRGLVKVARISNAPPNNGVCLAADIGAYSSRSTSASFVVYLGLRFAATC